LVHPGKAKLMMGMVNKVSMPLSPYSPGLFDRLVWHTRRVRSR
jgi:hypothetical protein